MDERAEHVAQAIWAQKLWGRPYNEVADRFDWDHNVEDKDEILAMARAALDAIEQKLVSSTLYYEDGRVETREHPNWVTIVPTKECPKVVCGRTIRCYKDVKEIVNRTPLL